MKTLNNIVLLLILAINLTTQSHAKTSLRIATTTSTDNSGLLAVLNPPFEKQNAIRLDVIVVGTGKALKLAENGDVDLVFVHAPAAEKAFVDAGYGVNRQAVMHNDFVLLGPANDPVHLKAAKTLIQALKFLSTQQAEFISRGDDSGTHKKENSLWATAGINPVGKWYISTGLGMGAALQVADEKQAYILSDRGTYLTFQDKIELQIVFANHPPLHNPYHVIAVNPKRYPFIKYDMAKKYIDYLTSNQGQTIIADFKMEGQQIFFPDVIPITTPTP
ncbi:MAG: substrate-binding domain-containing protein [Methylococcales bacterium]